MLRCNFDSKASTMRKKATVNRQLIKARTRAEEGEIKREERRGRNEGEEEEKEGEKKVERVGTRWHDLEGRGRVQARLKLPLCLTDLETARFAIARLHRPLPTTRLILHPRHKELSSSPGIIAALRGILQMEFPRLQGNSLGILRTGVQRIRSLESLSFCFSIRCRR